MDKVICTRNKGIVVTSYSLSERRYALNALATLLDTTTIDDIQLMLSVALSVLHASRNTTI